MINYIENNTAVKHIKKSTLLKEFVAKCEFLWEFTIP